MPTPIATLNPNGGIPKVEIVIGNAQSAVYDISLFDSTGHNPVEFARGSADGIPDIFPLPGSTVSELDNTTIFWRVVIQSFTGAAGENFAVTVRVIQDDEVVGSENRTGLVTDMPPEGFIRLQVRP